MKKITLLVSMVFLTLTSSTGLHGSENLLGDDWRNHWHLVLRDPGDPEDTFQVANGVLSISGDPYGYIRTKHVYHRYRLTLEWRWVDEPGNSGVLLHANGPDQVWPLCIEAQMRSGSAGDIVMIRTGAGVTVDGEEHLLTGDRMFGVIARKAVDIEKPAGEWNAFDIVCEGTSLKISINGELVNQGENMTLSSGFIAIQSEGAPLEVRNIRIECLD